MHDDDVGTPPKDTSTLPRCRCRQMPFEVRVVERQRRSEVDCPVCPPPPEVALFGWWLRGLNIHHSALLTLRHTDDGLVLSLPGMRKPRRRRRSRGGAR